MSTLATQENVAAKPIDAREAMERLNAEAGKFNIWLRTQANAPAQRPWFRDTASMPAAQSRAAASAPTRSRPRRIAGAGSEIGPYLDRIAEIARHSDVSPIEFADRQQFLLTNPGLGGRLQVTQYHPLRRFDLQSRRCRAGPRPYAQCEPHHPVGERRLHGGRRRALRGRARRPHPDAAWHLARSRQ